MACGGEVSFCFSLCPFLQPWRETGEKSQAREEQSQVCVCVGVCVSVQSHLTACRICTQVSVGAIQLFHHGTLQACPLPFTRPTSAVARHWLSLCVASKSVCPQQRSGGQNSRILTFFRSATPLPVSHSPPFFF